MIHPPVKVKAKHQVRKKPKTVRFDFVPANEYSLQALTDVYNQTRLDYVVPMPMNIAKLREYVENYDIQLEHSLVANYQSIPFGLAMLGVRADRTWVTRLGITSNGRRQGVGFALMQALIQRSQRLGADEMVLEVIDNNMPARHLFERLGFKQLRELRVIRRPPAVIHEATLIPGKIKAFGFDKAMDLLQTRTDITTWLTDTISMANTGNLSALVGEMPDGSSGWVVYQNTLLQLSRLVVETEQGDPVKVAQFLLQQLHRRHSFQDTVVENVDANDPHWPAYQSLGYFSSFVRIEMNYDLRHPPSFLEEDVSFQYHPGENQA